MNWQKEAFMPVGHINVSNPTNETAIAVVRGFEYILGPGEVRQITIESTSGDEVEIALYKAIGRQMALGETDALSQGYSKGQCIGINAATCT